MKCIEASDKVLVLRHPKRESEVEFKQRAQRLHAELCPPPKPEPVPTSLYEDMVAVAPGVSLPRRILAAAQEVGDYMTAHHGKGWKLCGIQQRER